MVPSALRMELTTGPGPEAGGSKNSISRPHCPEKSGMGELLSAAIVGQMNAAEKKTNAIVVAENRGRKPIRKPDMSLSFHSELLRAK
jgi:hypothetical protein